VLIAWDYWEFTTTACATYQVSHPAIAWHPTTDFPTFRRKMDQENEDPIVDLSSGDEEEKEEEKFTLQQRLGAGSRPRRSAAVQPVNYKEAHGESSEGEDGDEDQEAESDAYGEERLRHAKKVGRRQWAGGW
jgi:hypothetical protein